MQCSVHTDGSALGVYRLRRSGSLPSQLGRLTSLSAALYVSHNDLSGSLPSQLARATRLKALSLAHNALSGSLPEAYGALSALHQLLTYGNRMSGTVPAALANVFAVAGTFCMLSACPPLSPATPSLGGSDAPHLCSERPSERPVRPVRCV